MGNSAVSRVRMSVTFDKARLLSNLKRQSLRLTQRLDLPQNHVQILFAKHFYGENAVADIKRKINSGKIKGRIFFAAVAPDADKEILKMFVDQLPELLVSVATSPIASVFDGNFQQLILDVFSLTPDDLLKTEL